MSRSPLIVGLCVCLLGVCIGLFVPLDPIYRLWYQRDDTPLVLPNSELPRKQAVIDLLRQRRFEDLNGIYGLTLAADQHSATDTLGRFRAFAYADPSLKPFFDDWISAQTSTPLPFLARGRYYLYIAYVVRGENTSEETSADQFREMAKYLTLAGRDFRHALDVGPPSVAAYQGLIDIAITVSERHEAATLLHEALAETDNPLPLHGTYMRALKPQWGGSLGATRAYWESLRRSGTLRRPDHYLDFVGIVLKAEKACGLNDCEEAVHHYEKALRVMPEREGILTHARALAVLKRHNEALEVVEAGLQHDPDSHEHHELKAMILWSIGRRQEALSSFREALNLDPYNPGLLLARTQLADEIGRDEQQAGNDPAAAEYRWQSRQDLERAMVYGAPRGDVQLAWARMVLSSGEPRESAYTAFEEAIRLAPKEPEYVLAYANALSAAKDCKAMQFYRRFEKMCKGRDKCSKYAKVEHLTGSISELCGSSEEVQQIRRKRMQPGIVDQMLSCKGFYQELPVERALSQCTAKAQSGDLAAAYDMGVIYAYGYGVTIDHSTAVRWLESAAESGQPKAKGALGNFVYRGMGTEEDAERGLRLLHEAAGAGDVAAMLALGFIYYEGSHDDRDLQESRSWFAQASELGSHEARSALERFFSDEAISR